jgi:lysophospholipase L1-like esterase
VHVGVQIGCGVAALAAIGAGVWHLDKPSPAELRVQILRDAPTAPKGGVLLIGDSITEAEHIDILCGLPVFNAGIAGTTIEDWRGLAPYLVQQLKPKIVVYALGVNNAANKRPFDIAKWSANYRALRAPGSYIMGVWPIEPQKNPAFSAERVREMNAQLSGERGYIKPPSTPMTWDGVHLTWAGRSKWAETLRSICPAQ